MNRDDLSDYKMPSNYEPRSRTMAKVYQEAMKELAIPYPAMKVPGWDRFNDVTGGLRLREFSIFCGQTGLGKTQWLSNLSERLQSNGVGQYIASVETGATDWVKRQMSAAAKFDFNTGDPVALDRLKHFNEQHGKKFSNDTTHLALYDDRVPVEQLCHELIYHCLVLKCSVGIIDNLNFFMEVADERRQVLEMDRTVHSLVILAKRIPMHIILVAHPRKTDGGRVESEFDVKGSSTAVQEAHNIFLLNEPHPSMIQADPMKLVSARSHRELKFQKLRRRGKFRGSRLIFKHEEGSYSEGMHAYV